MIIYTMLRFNSAYDEQKFLKRKEAVAIFAGVLIPKRDAAATFRGRRRFHNILIIEI